jgi:CheY-like chemotaxis protein
MSEPKKVVAALEDLFFTVKINESAKRAGVAIEFVKSERDVLEKAKSHPTLIILDLNCNAIEPLKLIGELKANAETKAISLIGFLSHVQGELKQQAQEAGCDMVMARSVFSQNLLQILKRHSGLS